MNTAVRVDDPSMQLRKRLSQFYKRLTAPDSVQSGKDRDPNISQLFERLSAAWKEEELLTSSIHRLAMNLNYQRIIGMGKAALPYIFADLEREPNHWFWALTAITGEDPVPKEARGDMRAMTNAWLEWARCHGYRSA